MATDTQIRVRPARYGGFEATFTWHGELYRVFFQNSYDLACELAGECVDDQTIEAIIDCYEQLEWADTDYPLFQPADAVCDFGEPEYDPNSWAFDYREPPLWWDLLATWLRVGAVTAPWVLLVIGVRWLWGA